MKIHLPWKKKTWIILVIAIPIIFWSLSEFLLRVAPGINRIVCRYAKNSSSGVSGILTVFEKNSVQRRSLTGIKFPISGKTDPRLAHDRFQLRMTGLLEVKKPDIYWIGTDSDDGSWIWIDGKKVLDNGGLHSRLEKIDSVHLTKGLHFLELKFENLMGETYLDGFWVLPDGSHIPLAFRSFPYARIIPYLYQVAHIFFKIAQYWLFFLIPLLLFPIVFPVGPQPTDYEDFKDNPGSFRPVKNG